MKKNLKALIAVALTTFAFQVHAEDKVRLGFIAALSGPLGVLGAEQQRGLDLALEHLNNRLGNRTVELYTADSRGNPGVAVQEVSKLIDRDDVDIVTGATASNEVVALVKPIAAAGLTLVGSNGGPSPLAGKNCSPAYFSVAFQNDQWSEGMGKYMNEQGIKRAYFIGMDYQAGWDHVGGAERTFEGERLAKVFTPQSQLDFSAELAQIRAAKPDGVFAFYPGGAAIAFVKQYAQSGLDIPLFSNAGLVDTLFLDAFGEDALGVTVTSNYSAKLNNSANKKFVEDFSKKYGRDPSFYAAQQYDAVMLLNQAIAKLPEGKFDREKAQDLIGTTSFDSVRGNFEFNRNHMPIQTVYALKVVKGDDGKLALNLEGVATESAEDPYVAECQMGK
ncbi:ABC transporter substrate-binding protein [Neopusillimonas maritima]|uniref:Leucine-binding protein domain-containing protein n=1 Tax=Neopusillimonas maritima TaxID=2026239 RepID=A0ABX9MZ52_9BURK|nr:ABC transporter substrate-binding protein [Neopusillimonas maritima]RII83266.1 hypothetical protein CJO09_06595 [Neopusillimonas maritima]